MMKTHKKTQNERGSMKINGWVNEIRNLGGIKFIDLHTPQGNHQVTLVKGKVPEDLFKLTDRITRQSAISVWGEEKENKEAPRGKEIIPEKIEIVGLSETPLPFDPSGKTPAELDTRLDWRILDFRSKKGMAIFKVQNQILKSFRNYLAENGCIEIQPPCIIGAASEGGTEVFALPYFEKEAFLAQSPQLYKQMSAVSFGKVYMVTPVWRAEKHNTPVHLNEIRQMDMEMGFIESEEDVMKYAEEVFARILKDIKENCKEEMETLDMKINAPKLPFRRVTYAECIKELKKMGEEIEWGDDFSKAQEKMMEEVFGEIFFLKDWPEEVKPFYTMPNDDGKTCRAFDIIYKGLEILSGTQRIHIPDLLIKRIKIKGLNPKNFESYINCFRYGAPPHGGWSFGLERLTMTLTGVKNIREACMFPRDRHRLSP